MSSKNYEKFDLIPPQEMINFMLKYSFFHKQVIQIPSSITLDKKFDFDIMTKALNIEIERNDCLRLRFEKKQGKFQQYFIDEYKVDSVPTVSFKTKEEQDKFFTADAQKPIRHLKGQIFRIWFFTDYRGKTGIYLNITHLCMDMAAIFIFFADLLAIYDHLAEGKPMPKPLGSYRDLIKKELAYVNDKSNLEREEKVFTEFFLKDGDPLYAGVHGPELLEKERVKKKDPTLRAPSCFDPFHDKAALTKRPVSAEDSKIITDFLNEHQMSGETLIELGMRLHISKINYRTNDTYFVTLCPRRRTLPEKRSGGTMAEPLPNRIVLPENLTFMEAIEKSREVQSFLFRHMDYPYLESRELVRRLFNYSPIAASSSMMFSWFPIEADTMSGWKYEFEGYSIGYYIMPLYTYGMIDPATGCLRLSYLHRTAMITTDHINALHDQTIKALKIGCQNPDMTLGQILDIL